jgi:hypothetical protein
VNDLRIEISSKQKCFKYFSQHDDNTKSKLINGISKKFKISKSLAESYYYEWKNKYVNCDIKGHNRNPWHKNKNVTM